MNYLLDTCVISELASKNANPKVVRWIDSLSDESVFISVITIGEIQRGIELLGKSRKKKTLEDWLQNGVLIRFDGRILPIDTDLVLAWGSMIGELNIAGTHMPPIDSLIAATVRFHGLRLATRNTADFRHAGIALFNPWN